MFIAIALGLAGCTEPNGEEQPPPPSDADRPTPEADAGAAAGDAQQTAADPHRLSGVLARPRDDALEWAEPDEPTEIARAEVAARDAALEEVDVIREFHETYPDAIGYFERFHVAWTAPGQTIPWYSKAYLNGRYELTMRLPVTLTEDAREIEQVGEPEFYLVELRRISDGPGPGFRTHIGRTGVFGETKWRQLRDADGRLEDILDDVRTDEPVDLFDEYAEHQRLLHERRLLANAEEGG